MKQALIIMAKQPAAGKTKTRLCPPLTLDQAAQLYECFLADIVEIARKVQHALPHVQTFFAYTPDNSQPYFTQLAPDFSLVPQLGDTLGDRLDYVLSTCLKQGFDQVAAINSDSPNLPVDYLTQAFDQLAAPQSTDIVFGPSEDGGYYLIGTTQPWINNTWPRIVRDVTMSTPTVLADSLRIADQEGARVHLLPSWYDIDTIDELTRLINESDNSTDSKTNTQSFIRENLVQFT